MTGNTTNLQQHLDKHHRSESTETTLKSAPRKVENKQYFQPKIDHPVTKPISHEKKKKLDDLTLKLMVGKVLPMSLVDNKHFKALLNELEPR